MVNVTVVKTVAQIIGGLGVSKVVGQVIQNNTTIVTVTDAILVRAGSLVISSIAIDHATSHIGDIFDNIVENIEIRRTEKNKTNETDDVIEGQVIESQDETADGA